MRKILVKTIASSLNPESSGQLIILIERLSRLVGSGASRSRYPRRRAHTLIDGPEPDSFCEVEATCSNRRHLSYALRAVSVVYSLAGSGVDDDIMVKTRVSAEFQES